MPTRILEPSTPSERASGRSCPQKRVVFPRLELAGLDARAARVATTDLDESTLSPTGAEATAQGWREKDEPCEAVASLERLSRPTHSARRCWLLHPIRCSAG